MKIEINNLTKSFGDKKAVDIPAFTINKGDVLGLVGNNGAGKTTLFRLILDLLQADQGVIIIDDHINPAQNEEWKKLTGAYIDDGFLIDFLTPEEYFQFIGKVSIISQEQISERLNEFEHFMGGEILGQKKLIRNLSAGNKQKVGIISALLSRPSLVILDEPFNFLDPTSQSILKRMLTDYNKQTQATILISSHNLAHTIDISSRIALLEHGSIIRDIVNADGKAEEELKTYFDAED